MRTRARLAGTVLPTDWRHRTNSRVWMMLAKVPEADYELTQRDFETHARGRLSEDWTAEVHAYCRAILLAPPIRGLFG